MCSEALFLHWEPEDWLSFNTCIERDLSHPRSLPFFLMHWHLKATSYNKAEKLWQSSYMQFWWSKHLIIQEWVISAVTSFCHDCITSANSPKQKIITCTGLKQHGLEQPRGSYVTLYSAEEAMCFKFKRAKYLFSKSKYHREQQR